MSSACEEPIAAISQPFPSHTMNPLPTSRREFLRASALAGGALLGARLAAQNAPAPAIPSLTTNLVLRSSSSDDDKLPGAQRVSVEKLRQWEAMKFGMFIHFGMSTFVEAELPSGSDPSTTYAPDRLDVDQWIGIARDAGMKYAVLTTKHVAGHCLWPSKLTDYHVGTSGNKTDVVEAFLKACERRGVKPGFYYCAWDNHNRFGSLSPNVAPIPLSRTPLPTNRSSAFVTRRYLDFHWAQVNELMENYGPIAEWWFDIPHLLPRYYRDRLYAHIAARQPDALILFNHGIGDGSEIVPDRVWPTDLMTIERFLPNAATAYVKWRNLEGRNYYIPGEVCEPIGNDWFHTEKDRPRSDAELLGMYLTSVSRGANLLLDVGPDRHGLIPDRFRLSLERLRRNLDMLGM